MLAVDEDDSDDDLEYESDSKDPETEGIDTVSQLLQDLGSVLTPLTDITFSAEFMAHIQIPEKDEEMLERMGDMRSDTLSSAKLRLVNASDTLAEDQVDQIVGELNMRVKEAAGAFHSESDQDSSDSASDAASVLQGSGPGSDRTSSAILSKQVNDDTSSGILESWSLAVVRMLSADNDVSGSVDLKRPDMAVAAAVVAEATLQATMSELTDAREDPFLVDADLQERLSQWEVLLIPESENTADSASDSDNAGPPLSAVTVAVPLEVVYHVFESMTTALKAFRVVIDRAEKQMKTRAIVSECKEYRKDIKWLTMHWHWAFEQATGIPADVVQRIAGMSTFVWETGEEEVPSIRRRAPPATPSRSSDVVDLEVNDGEESKEGVAHSPSKASSSTSGSESDDSEWTAADIAEAVGAQKSGKSESNTVVPVWMKALSREQTCEYFIKQRDEFIQVGELLMDRELARKAAIEQFGSLDQATVPEAAAQFADPRVVWEQQEVLADIESNLKLLYKQAAARLGTDVETLGLLDDMNPGGVAEMKRMFCESEASDKEASEEEIREAYESLYAVLQEYMESMPPLTDLEEPPRVANGKQKADRVLVERVRSETLKMLQSNSDEASEALKSASESVDVAELASVEAPGTDESGAGDATGGKSPRVYKAIQELVDPEGRNEKNWETSLQAGDMSQSMATASLAAAGFSTEESSPKLRARCEEYIQRLGSQNESEVQRVRCLRFLGLT